MSLETVAARAALIKRANLGRLALAAGSIGAAGAAGLGLAHAFGRPDPDPEPEPAPAAPAAPPPPRPQTLRDRLRSRIAGLAAGGAGTVLGKWYGAATGKGAAT